MDSTQETVLAWIRRDLRRCSFCRRPVRILRRLIAGPNAYICDLCVVACAELLYEFDHQVLPRLAPHVVALNADAECVLCRTIIQPDEGVHVAGRGGPLCRECVDAILAGGETLGTDSGFPQ